MKYKKLTNLQVEYYKTYVWDYCNCNGKYEDKNGFCEYSRYDPICDDAYCCNNEVIHFEITPEGMFPESVDIDTIGLYYGFKR